MYCPSIIQFIQDLTERLENISICFKNSSVMLYSSRHQLVTEKSCNVATRVEIQHDLKVACTW